MSTIEDMGFDDLKNCIKKIYNLEKIVTHDLTYLTNARSISILKNIIKIIEDVETSVANCEYIDMIEIDLKIIWQQLGEIIGETYEEELIDQLFKQFCLGK